MDDLKYFCIRNNLKKIIMYDNSGESYIFELLSIDEDNNTVEAQYFRIGDIPRNYVFPLRD